MVTEPVVTTLPTALPEIDPIRALDTTATLAGPPVLSPAIAVAASMKNSPTPEFTKKAAKITKTAMKVADTPRGTVKRPSVLRYSYEMNREISIPGWLI